MVTHMGMWWAMSPTDEIGSLRLEKDICWLDKWSHASVYCWSVFLALDWPMYAPPRIYCKQATERASDAINSCFHAYLSHAMIIFINNASPFQLKIILGFLFHFLDIAVHFDFFFHAMPLSISVHMHTHSLPPWLESYNYNL